MRSRKESMTKTLAVLILLASVAGCSRPPSSVREQELPITLSDDHHEGGSITGWCSLNEDTGDELTCEFHNGLADWTVTELTIRVTDYYFTKHYPTSYFRPEVRDYRVRVRIEPLTVERTPTFKLAMSLFTGLRGAFDWDWKVVGARGVKAPR